MIDTRELRRLAQAATPGPDGVSLNWVKLLQDFQKEANPAAVSELIDRLESAEKERDSYKLVFIEYSEKTEWVQRGVNDGTVSTKYLGWHRADVMADMLKSAESDALEQARLNGMGSEREAALMAKVEAAEKSDAESIAMYRKARDERDALRAKITEMERQEPFDADSDVFRSAFEAALKAGNWPAARQGDGYRTPTTQIAWLLASSTIDRLKLYRAPAQKENEMTADKRRIDACLKACEGISTQNLEDNVPVLELARRYNALLRDNTALRAKVETIPYGAIEKNLTEVMDIATANGANSVSMPDEYVEVAAWLCGVPSAKGE